MGRRTGTGRGRRGLLVIGVLLVAAGLIVTLLPFVAKTLNYWTAANYAKQLEASIGIPDTQQYGETDYAAMPVAENVVYSSEELEQAQWDQTMLEELMNLGDAFAGPPQASDDAGAEIPDGTAILQIPSINLEISAIRCKTFASMYRAMRLGAAIFPKAPQPNEIGNICFSAHRTGSRDYFRHIDQISVGDAIFLHTADLGSYRYEVVKVEIIAANDWSVTRKTDYPAITLISCQAYQGVSNGKRIIVRAKLVSSAAQ